MSEYVPLNSRDGIVGYALVDECDGDRVMRLRWQLNEKGYVVGRTRRSEGHEHAVRLHRVVLGLERGDARQVDHINGDKLDNRRANLRLATNVQNHQNQGTRRNNTSGVTGVSWNARRGKWKATVRIDKREHHLGYFSDRESAAEVVRAKRAQHAPFSRERRELEAKWVEHCDTTDHREVASIASGDRDGPRKLDPLSSLGIERPREIESAA